TDLPDLATDLRERRVALLGHGVTFVCIVLAATLVLVQPSAGGGEIFPQAFLAYEEAMGRLRDRGQVREQEHAEERRRMEEQIQDKEALARAGELTAGMAHELRNGLGTILGYARLLERETLSVAGQDAGQGIREECNTLENIVRRFVDYVKREDLNPVSF